MLHHQPLKDRILKPDHQQHQHSCIVTMTKSYRPPQYKSWSEETMEKAYTSVLKNGMSVRKAAEVYNVPKSTLGDRVSGRTIIGSKSGPKKILSDQQEDCLDQFLIGCSSIGFAKSRIEVISLINRMY